MTVGTSEAAAQIARTEYVIGGGVELTPVSRLGHYAFARPLHEGDVAVARPDGRASAVVVDAALAALLARFRNATTIAAAIVAHAREMAVPATRLAERAVPAMYDLIRRGFVVPATSRMEHSLAPLLAPGDEIAGLTVGRCVAAMDDTEVYRAWDGTGLTVALKVARPSAVDLVRPQLHREEAALRRVGGWPAPALVACGNAAGLQYLATAWCEGLPVSARLRELRTLPPVEGRASRASLAAAIADAFAVLHSCGILHGDVHADNVLVTRAGAVTLIDFGFALVAGASSAPPRAGAPQHYEPERARTGASEPEPPLTEVGEQYSVATLLYEVACGAPYLALYTERTAALRQIAEDPPRPFADHGLAWPDMEAVLGRALAKAPADRFPTTDAFARALARVARAARVPPPRAAARLRRTADAVRPALQPLLDERAPVGLGRAPRRAQLLAACAPLAGPAAVAHAFRRLAVLREDPALLAAAERWAFAVPTPRGATARLELAAVRAAVAHTACDAWSLREAAAELARALAAGSAARTSGRAPARAAHALLLAATALEAARDAEPPAPAARRTLVRATAALRSAVAAHARAAPSPADRARCAHALLRWAGAAGARPTARLAHVVLRALRAAAGEEHVGVPARASAHAARRTVERLLVIAELALEAHARLGHDEALTIAAAAARRLVRALDARRAAAAPTSRSRSAASHAASALEARAAHALLRLYRATGDRRAFHQGAALAERAAAASLAAGGPCAPLDAALLAAELERPHRARAPLLEPDGWPTA